MAKNLCCQFLLLVCHYWVRLPGAEAQFRFLTTWPPLTTSFLSRKAQFDCSTNDPEAVTELWKMFQKLPVEAGNLTKEGDVYTIPRITVTDKGLYTCKAVSKTGTRLEKSTMLMPISGMSPSYDYTPRTVQVRQVGENVTFQVTATVVKPVINWHVHVTVNGKDAVRPITAEHNITVVEKQSSRTSILTLTNLRLQDGGHYVALGTYNDQEDSMLFTVDVYAPSQPVIMRLSGNSTTREKTGKILDCVAFGYPPPELAWFKNGAKLQRCERNCKDTHHQQLATHKAGNRSESSVTIKEVTFSDDGLYKCEATNSNGKAQAISRLTVYSKPVLDKPQGNLFSQTINKEVVIKVKCTLVSGKPLPNFLWQYQSSSGNTSRNGCTHEDRWLPLPSSITYETPLNQTSASSTIVIPPNIPPKSQAACFRCLAVNQFGNDSFITEIYRNIPRTVKFPNWPTTKFLTAYFGGGTRFNCTTNEDNVNTSLWFADHSRLWRERHPNGTGKITKLKDVFTLTGLTVRDVGQYQCRAKILMNGKETEFQTKEILLTASHAPSIDLMISPSLHYIVSGEDFNISCRTDVLDQTSQMLEWFTEDSEGNIMNQTVTKYEAYQFKKNSSLYSILMIKNAERGEVIYGCKLTVVLHLSLGRKETSAKYARLYVKDYEPLTVSLLPKTYVKEFTSLALNCSVRGFPQPKISWYKNGYRCGDVLPICGAVVGATEKYLLKNEWIGKLLFTSPSLKNNVGNYSCRATNKRESRNATTELIFYGEPVFSVKETNNYETEGTSLKLECQISRGFPLPSIVWYYQHLICRGTNLACRPDESKWTPLPYQMVEYPPKGSTSSYSQILVTATDEDILYKCEASNRFGTDSTIIKLITSEDPYKIQTKPRKTRVNAKETLKFTCSDQNAVFIRLSWFRNDANITSTNDPRLKVEITKEEKLKAVLWIKNTTVDDSGKYTCVAESSTQTTVNQTVIATVDAVTPPKIETLPIPSVVENNSTWVALTCNVTANPTAEVYWFHDGKIISLHELFITSTNSCMSRRTGYFYFSDDKNKNTLVICHPENVLHTGNYKCLAKNSEGEAEANMSLDVLAAPLLLQHEWPERKTAKLETSLNLTCAATGNPQTHVEWRKYSNGKETMISRGIGEKGAKLVIDAITETDFGHYTCVAWNRLGKITASFELRQETGHILASRGIKEETIYAVVAGCVAFVVVFLVILFIFVKRQSKKLDRLRKQHFCQGDFKLDPDRTLLEQAGDLPYDSDWEFPEVRLSLGETIGTGAFGQVFKGEAIGIALLAPRDKTQEAVKQREKLRRNTKIKNRFQDSGGFLVDRTQVAVKTLKDNATETDYKNLALEMKIMIHLGEHHNIINILGACTIGKKLKMIMEYAPHGCLLNLLRSKREIYKPVWTKKRNTTEEEFTLVDQVMMSYHVACGMEYLASKKCIHRDLAARNVLIGDNYVAKIADFGLAREVYKDNNYVMTSTGLLPLKWMAPESIFDRVYTEKSDAWSFGILCWEMFTLGGTPYPGVPPAALADYLSEGQRMPRPRDCPADMYAIMKDCWNEDADRRPKFTNIAQRIARILNKHVVSGRESSYVHLTIADEHQESSPKRCDSFRIKPKRSSQSDEFKRPPIPRRVPIATIDDGSDDELDALLPETQAIPPDYDVVVPNPPYAKEGVLSLSSEKCQNDIPRSFSDKSSDGESGICMDDMQRGQNTRQVEVEMSLLANSDRRKKEAFHSCETLV